jgi:transcriptional regulator of arginine metabolism
VPEVVTSSNVQGEHGEQARATVGDIEIVDTRIVSSQEDLRKLLLHRGWDVTQATLSRDLRELRLARVPTPEGARYAVTDGTIEESRVALETLLPQLFCG